MCSAVLFGLLSVTLSFAMRRVPDAEVGALVTGIVALIVCGTIALVDGGWSGDLVPFLLAGLIAPGVSQILYVRAVRDAGASRTAVVVGVTPLISVTIAMIALGEPFSVPLMGGALLIVLGGIALAGERVRPHTFRAVGVAFALGCSVLFATRDNVVRGVADGTDVPAPLAAVATLASGTALIAAFLIVTRRRVLPAQLSRALPAFAVSGVVWGTSYVTLFEAYYRSRVTVVAPMVSTESLFAVAAAWLFLRRHEHIGPHIVLGAVFVVAGGVLIGVFR
jgi:drug/metabolite transporter (DMT)-like permease